MSTIIITDKASYESMKQAINEDPETGLTNKLLFLGELKDKYIAKLEEECREHRVSNEELSVSNEQINALYINIHTRFGEAAGIYNQLRDEHDKLKTDYDVLIVSHTQAMDQLLKIQELLHTAEGEREHERLALICMEELYKQALTLHVEGKGCPPDSFIGRGKCDHNCWGCWEAYIKSKA